MKAFHICGGLLLAVALHLRAQTDDSDFPLGPTHVPYDFAPWCQVGDHKLIFQSTTLSDVIRILGAGTIRPDPAHFEAGDYNYFVDYTDGKNLIEFLSDCDLGGLNHVLGGILIEPLPKEKKLPELPLLSLPVILPFGIPETDLASLERQLGTAAIQKGWVYYEFVGKKPAKDMSGKIYLGDVTTRLRAALAGKKIASVVIWHDPISFPTL